MHGLYKCVIVRSSWIDHVKLTLVKSGFDCVRERESFSGVNSLCKHISDSLKHDFRKCWYKEIEDSTKCLFYRYFQQRTDNKNTYHFCLMPIFSPYQKIAVVITDFRQKKADIQLLLLFPFPLSFFPVTPLSPSLPPSLHPRPFFPFISLVAR